MLELSIIIPAYNSQKYVVKVITGVIYVLSKKKINFEVILVSDGSTDNTLKYAEKISQKYPSIVRVFGYVKNKGKGYAVSFGMKKARGKIVGFIDCDREIDPVSIISLFDTFKKKEADIVVGSKWHVKSNTVYPKIRKFISRSYFLLVKMLFNLPITDTQAGVKLYKKAVINKIQPYCRTSGFAFDVEWLATAYAVGYKKIFDAPIKVFWGKVDDASLLKSFRLIFESSKMFLDTLDIFFRTRKI